MKHFSTSVLGSHCLALGIDDALTSEACLICQRAIMIAMDENPDDMTDGGEAVLANFIRWFRSAKESDRYGRCPVAPIFFYANLSDGHTQAIILTDAKGKLVLG